MRATAGRVALIGLLLAASVSGSAQLYDPGGPRQLEHDQARLERARANSTATAGDERAAQARRERQRERLARLEAERAALAGRLEELNGIHYRMGEASAQVFALARSSAVDLANRLRAGATGKRDQARVDDADALSAAPAGLDGLYGLWYALQEELGAAAAVERFDAPVTFRDGVRVSAPVTRFGHQLLAARGSRLESSGESGLIESPLPLPAHPGAVSSPPGSWRFARPADARQFDPSFAEQRRFEGGWVGVLILLCAAGGVLLIGFQSLRLLVWNRLLRNRDDPSGRLHRVLSRQRAHLITGERRAGSPREQVIDRRAVSARDRYLRVIASAAMLLGLLGTVVGLIHTFQALAIYGGTEASLAAAGISHALSTTWLGLSVAIPLLLCQVALTTWRRRVENHVALHVLHAGGSRGRAPQARVPARKAHARRWPRLMKNPLALSGGALLGVALFVLMQWLIQQAPAEPPVAERSRPLQRISWRDTPTPPPTTQTPTANRDARSSYSSAALPSLPALPAPDLPAPAIALPALGGDGVLAGLLDGGGAALAGMDGEWLGVAGEDAFAGRDLVPISSARPKYPRAAARTGTEGWVELVFTISASGKVSNIRVIDAEPPGIFENAAADAMSKWLYAPLYRDGKPVTREATQLFRFKASDIQELHLYDGG